MSFFFCAPRPEERLRPPGIPRLGRSEFSLHKVSVFLTAPSKVQKAGPVRRWWMGSDFLSLQKAPPPLGGPVPLVAGAFCRFSPAEGGKGAASSFRRNGRSSTGLVELRLFLFRGTDAQIAVAKTWKVGYTRHTQRARSPALRRSARQGPNGKRRDGSGGPVFHEAGQAHQGL